MFEFKDYLSKPVTRRAYQIKEEDEIYNADESNLYYIGHAGQTVVFAAHEVPVVGGWVIYLNDDDIYYYNDEVFRERNMVP